MFRHACHENRACTDALFARTRRTPDFAGLCDRSGVSASISSTSSSDESSSSASCTPIRSRHRYIQPGPWPRNESRPTRVRTRFTGRRPGKTRCVRGWPLKNSDNELLPPWRDEAEQDRRRLAWYCSTADVSSAGESFGELIMHTALSRYANSDNAFSDAHGDLTFYIVLMTSTLRILPFDS